MPYDERLNARTPQKITDELRYLIEMIEAAIDPKNPKCNFSAFNETENVATKERIRLYFQSWVLPNLQAVLSWSEGGKVEMAFGRLFRKEDREAW